MAFRPRNIPVEKITYAVSTLKTRELPKTVYRGLILELDLVHTNDAAVTITADIIVDVLQSIAVVVDGQDRIVQMEGRDLFYMNQYDFSIAPFSSLFTTVCVQGTSTIQLYLPFVFTRALRPEDALLDARRVSNITLEITFGNIATALGVTTVDSGQVKIMTDEYANAPRDLAVARHEINAVNRNLDVVGKVETKLETGGNNQYRRLLCFTRGGSDELSDAEISDLTVKSRGFHYANFDEDQLLQEWNRQQYGIAHQTGLYVVDFTRDGQMTQRINARELNELIVEVTSTVTDGVLRVVKDKAIFAEG